MNYEPEWRNEALPQASRKMGRVAHDDRADWREVWALSPSDVFYVWHGGLHAGLVEEGLTGAGLDVRSQIIWVKPSLVISRGAYHWQHEPCWYAVRKGKTAGWIGDRKQATTWFIDPVPRARTTEGDDAWTEHSTQKPVEAMERPMRNHGGDVYDPFAGSGSTLIAAERQARTCFAMEIDPRYVAVIVDRWEAFTGRKAERL